MTHLISLVQFWSANQMFFSRLSANYLSTGRATSGDRHQGAGTGCADAVAGTGVVGSGLDLGQDAGEGARLGYVRAVADVDLGRLGLQPVACGLAHPLRPQCLVAAGQDERAGSDATCRLIPASSFLTVASLVSASRCSVYPVGIYGAGASAVRAPKSAR